MFFTHDQFDTLVLASLSHRGAVMLQLARWGYRANTAAVLADAVIGKRYHYTEGGVVIEAR